MRRKCCNNCPKSASSGTRRHSIKKVLYKIVKIFAKIIFLPRQLCSQQSRSSRLPLAFPPASLPPPQTPLNHSTLVLPAAAMLPQNKIMGNGGRHRKKSESYNGVPPTQIFQLKTWREGSQSSLYIASYREHYLSPAEPSFVQDFAISKILHKTRADDRQLSHSNTITTIRRPA